MHSVKDLHEHVIDGMRYRFRTPTCFDLPRLRRTLTRQGLRRPQHEEFRIASIAGIVALATAIGDPAEGERQKELIKRWYELLEPIREEDIDEPDLEARAAELERLKAERRADQLEIFAEVAAIEANLSRHWPPYAELLADRTYWDEISAIEIVRLLLVKRAKGDDPEETMLRDPDGLLTDRAFQSLPKKHRRALADFATGLLAPDEAEIKN